MISIEDKRKLINDIKDLKENQLHNIYQMIKQETDKYTCNSNGIFINLKNLNENTISKIITYTNNCIEINKNSKKENNTNIGIDDIYDTNKKTTVITNEYIIDSDSEISDESELEEED